MTSQQKLQKIQQFNFNLLNIHLHTKIVNYLTQQQLTTVSILLEDHEEYEILTKIIKNRITMIGYLNKCDRSYYFGIYSLPIYQQYEEKNIQSLSIYANQSIICEFPNKFKNAIRNCKNFVSEEIRQQFGQQLQVLFIDPCLPLPKLLRQNVAAKVCSPFQNFLISKLETQNSFKNQCQPIFQQIQQKFQQNQQVIIYSLIGGNCQKVNQLRKFAHLITYSNMNNKLIQQNYLHNLLVSLSGLTQLYLSAIEHCLKNIENPLQLLLELCTRYAQFESTVISMQQNLGNLFKLYGELYGQIYDNNEQFSYWKIAYTMWIAKMQQFYQKTNQVYVQLISEQSQQNINKILQNQNLMSISQELKDKFVNKQSYNLKERSMLYTLLKEQGDIQILVNSYLEHLVDISINQRNIIYCGHSKQRLDEPFMNMQFKIIEEQTKFIEQLKHLKLSDKDVLKLKQIVDEKINHYLAILKPTTIMKLNNLYMQQNLSEQTQKIKPNDTQIEHYIQYIKRTNRNIFQHSSALSMYKIALGQIDKSEYPTACSEKDENIEQIFQFYHSDAQSEEQVSIDLTDEDQDLDSYQKLSKST